MDIYSIGHSNVPLETLIDLLRRHGVTTLVDVRSAPYTRYATWFDREQLEKPLREAGIAYHYAGNVLGGRPKDPSCYREGRLPEGKADYTQLVDYHEVRKRDWFQNGIARLIELADQSSTAIMCSEEDPWRCHRHRLISTELLSRGIVTQHIRGSGKVEPANQPPPVQMQLL